MMRDAGDWHRQPGRGTYARPELERRFLLAGEPPTGRASRRIEDRYLDGTRLRLRHVSSGGASVYKLTQKVRLRDEDPAELAITNTYLSAEEHALLSGLPGRSLIKTRSVCRVGGHDIVVDDFHGRLRGLRLAEVEVDDLRATLTLPDWLGEEVTHDDRFAGGPLARAADDQIRDLLRAGPT